MVREEMSISTVDKLKSMFSPQVLDLSSLKAIMYTLHPLNLIAMCKNYAMVAVSHIVRLCPFVSHEADHIQNHDAMVHRLHRMKENFDEKEKRLRLDPFQRTFLEKSREYFSYGFGNRENSLKVKLQMFAGSVWCREHADGVIDQAIKVRHNVITAFDFDSPEALDKDWVPMIFSESSASAVQAPVTNAVSTLAQSAAVGMESLAGSDSDNEEDFAPVLDLRPSQEICSVSDLFLSAQKYFADANLFGADRYVSASLGTRSGEDGFDDLNMTFSQEDMALFKAAIDGVPLKFA